LRTINALALPPPIDNVSKSLNITDSDDEHNDDDNSDDEEKKDLSEGSIAVPSSIGSQLLKILAAATSINDTIDKDEASNAQEELEPNESGISAVTLTAELAGRLLCASVQSQPSSLKPLLKSISLETWLENALLACTVEGVRAHLALTLAKLADLAHSDDSTLLRRALVSLLPLASSKYANRAEQYFAALRDVTVASLHSKKTGASVDAAQLFVELVAHVLSHKSRESVAADAKVDYALVGQLQLITALVKIAPDVKHSVAVTAGGGLLTALFHDGLFAIPHAGNAMNADAPPQCKTSESRRAAFNLLLALCEGAPDNRLALLSMLQRHTDKTARDLNDSWSHAPSRKAKAPSGYVGLQNQGATCYMNSLLQQLYCVPQLRSRICAVDLGDVEKRRRKKNRDKEKERNREEKQIVIQLQIMFANLRESLRRFYDTSDFCKTLKDFDGNPINVGQQMDANEFFNMLFDKLDQQLRPTPQARLLRTIFGGYLSNQLISEECGHSSERPEPFYSITIEIKNKSRIEESLDLFIEGEMLAGVNKYFCERCGIGRDTRKRCVIKTLPNILVMNLKRFEFDYNNMTNFKLNDKCAFPMEIDMTPYTVEGVARREALEAANIDGDVNEDDDNDENVRKSKRRARQSLPPHALPPLQPPQYYKYRLTGITVHQGTADSGHYYSYIRERESPSRVDNDDKSENRWFEFNDTNVTPFDPADIPKECFGGSVTFTRFDPETGEHIELSRDKVNNAYILFYERTEWFECNDDAEKPSEPASDIPRATSQLELSNADLPTVVDSDISDKENDDNEVQKQRHNASDLDEKSTDGKENAEITDKSSQIVEKPNVDDDNDDNDDNDKLKVKKTPAIVVDGPENDVSLVSKPLMRAPSPALSIKSNDIDERANKAVLAKIWQTNTQFLTERFVFNDEYFQFVWQLTRADLILADGSSKDDGKRKKRRNKSTNGNNTPEDCEPMLMEASQLCYSFLLTVVARAAQAGKQFPAWSRHLEHILTASPTSAERFIRVVSGQDSQRTVEMLWECPTEDARVSFVELIAHALKIVAPNESPIYSKLANARARHHRQQRRRVSHRRHSHRAEKDDDDDDNDKKKNDDDDNDKKKNDDDDDNDKKKLNVEVKKTDKHADNDDVGRKSNSRQASVGANEDDLASASDNVDEESKQIDEKDVDGEEETLIESDDDVDDDNTEQSSNSVSSQSSQHKTPSTVELLDLWVSLMGDLRFNARAVMPFFRLLRLFADVGHRQRRLLLRRGMVTKIADLFLGEHQFAPVDTSEEEATLAVDVARGVPRAPRPQYTKTVVGARWPLLFHWRDAATLFALLVCSCRTDKSGAVGAQPSTLLSSSPQKPPTLPASARRAVLRSRLLSLWLRDNVSVDACAAVLCHWAWQDRVQSRRLLSLVRDGLEASAKPNHAAPFLKLLDDSLAIRDGLTQFRVEHSMVAFVRALDTHSNRRHLLVRLTDWLIANIANYPQIQRWCALHAEMMNEFLLEAGFKIQP